MTASFVRRLAVASLLYLASSKDAGLAMKFAHSLVKLTDPRAILYALGEFLGRACIYNERFT